jgi:hypothetical protein
VFLLFLAVLAVAIVLVARGGRPSGGQGWPWFVGWAVASTLFVVGISTSLGILLAPVAIPLFLWVGIRSPYWGEALGGLVGFGFALVLFADRSDWQRGWYLGCAGMLAGVCGYAQVLTRREAPATPPRA